LDDRGLGVSAKGLSDLSVEAPEALVQRKPDVCQARSGRLMRTWP
jgi:hypothetical protein